MARRSVVTLLCWSLLLAVAAPAGGPSARRNRREESEGGVGGAPKRRMMTSSADDGSSDLGDEQMMSASEERSSGDVGDGAEEVEESSPPPHLIAKGGHIPLTEINEENESTGGEASKGTEEEDNESNGGGVWPTFRSATLNVRLQPVPSVMNPARETIFATAVTRFLNKVFEGQSTYDIAVRSVNVIRQDMGSEESRRQRRLAYWGREDVGKGRDEQARKLHEREEILDVEVVIAAQYVEANSLKSLTSEHFGKLLLRIFNKFEEHLIQYMRDLEDERSGGDGDPEEVYFASIEEVVVESYLAAVTDALGAEPASAAPRAGEKNEDGLDTTAIVAIVFGSLGLAAFVAAIFIKLSWEGKLGMGKNGSKSTGKVAASSSYDIKDYNIQDIVHTNSFTYSTNEEVIKSLGSSGSGSGRSSRKKKQSRQIFRKKDRGLAKDEFDEQISKYDMSSRYGISEEDEDVREGDAESTRLSTDDSVLKTEMERVARIREFTAPPGKLGVAIDSVNGHPVVHRIKEGSPLVGVLQRLDRIISIDGTDTSNMSAADVTYLMVKGMNKPRKITFIREE